MNLGPEWEEWEMFMVAAEKALRRGDRQDALALLEKAWLAGRRLQEQGDRAALFPQFTERFVGFVVNLAHLYEAQGMDDRAEQVMTDLGRMAEPLVREALAQAEARHGPEHPLVADVLDCLAYLLHLQDRHSEAAPVEARARRLLALCSLAQLEAEGEELGDWRGEAVTAAAEGTGN